MYQKVAAMFLVENVDEAVAWYGEVFGAELHASLPRTVKCILSMLRYLVFAARGALTRSLGHKWFRRIIAGGFCTVTSLRSEKVGVAVPVASPLCHAFVGAGYEPEMEAETQIWTHELDLKGAAS